MFTACYELLTCESKLLELRVKAERKLMIRITKKNNSVVDERGKGIK